MKEEKGKSEGAPAGCLSPCEGSLLNVLQADTACRTVCCHPCRSYGRRVAVGVCLAVAGM